jgi:hypothetical protein
MFVHELREFCPIICACCRQRPPLPGRAAVVAARLAAYGLCRFDLERGGIRLFFRENGDDPRIKKASERFPTREEARSSD